MTRFSDLQVAGVIGIVLFAFLFGGSLLAIFTGTINGFVYTGANIDVTDRVFKDEQVEAVFEVGSVQPAFNPSEIVNVTGNNLIEQRELHRQVYAWFLDGELVQLMPGEQTVLEANSTNLIVGSCQGGTSGGRTFFGNLIGSTDSTICPMHPNYNLSSFDSFSSIGENLNQIDKTYSINASDLSVGTHTISLRSLEINRSACGYYGVVGDPFRRFVNLRLDMCPLYTADSDGVFIGERIITSGTTEQGLIPLSLQFFTDYGIENQRPGFEQFYTGSDQWILKRNFEETKTLFAPRFSTITSSTFTILEIPSPLEEICGNGIDDDADGSIDEGCEEPPIEPPITDFEFNPLMVIAISLIVLAGIIFIIKRR